MARLAAARWNPVSFQGQLGWMAAPPATVFVHTNGGGANIAGPNGYFSNAFNDPSDPNYRVGIGATFQVYWDGTADQMCDTQQIIWAEFQASRWAASIETQDDDNPATPWTDAQMATLVTLFNQLGVAKHLMGNPYDAGVGYHEMWTPTWNDNYHDCPGSVRTAQLRGEVMQEFQGQQAPDPVLSALPLLQPGDVGHNSQATAARALLNAWTGPTGPLLPYLDAAGNRLDYAKTDTALAFAIGHFQSAHGLTVDMKVGPQTWEALLHVRTGLPALSVKDPTHWGQFVLNLRSLLGAHGYFLLSRTGTDWDVNVSNCLLDFQRKSGLTADGVVGTQTWAALLNVKPKTTAMATTADVPKEAAA